MLPFMNTTLPFMSAMLHFMSAIQMAAILDLIPKRDFHQGGLGWSFAGLFR